MLVGTRDLQIHWHFDTLAAEPSFETRQCIDEEELKLVPWRTPPR